MVAVQLQRNPQQAMGTLSGYLPFGAYGLPPVMLISLHKEIGEDIFLDSNFHHITKKLTLDMPHVEESFCNNPEVLDRQCKNMMDLIQRGYNMLGWKPGAVSTTRTIWEGKVNTEMYSCN